MTARIFFSLLCQCSLGKILELDSSAISLPLPSAAASRLSSRSLASPCIASSSPSSFDLPSNISSSFSSLSSSPSRLSFATLKEANLPDVLPARQFISLVPTSNELHYTMQVSYGGQSLQLLLDTTGEKLWLLDALYCRDHLAYGKCFQFLNSEILTCGNLNAVMDTEPILSRSLKGTLDNLSIGFKLLGSTRLSQLQSARQKSCVMNDLTYELGGTHRMQGTDGIIGLGVIENMTQSAFALDLLGVGKDSVLWLGGIDEAYRDRLSWGNLGLAAQTRGFPISSFEVCGTELLTPERQPYIEVDTRSACLVLPAPLFDTLVSRLPLQCEARPLTEDVICKVPSDVPLHLPTISFRPAGGGDLFVISLNDLVLGSSRQLCVRRGHLDARSIILGNRCLRSLFVAFNGMQLGFSNKSPVVKRSNVQCAEKMRCKGMQEVYATYNMCMDPPCSNYYFYQFDNVNKVCYFTGTFHALVVTLMTIFILVEFVLQELELYLGRKVIEDYPLSAVA